MKRSVKIKKYITIIYFLKKLGISPIEIRVMIDEFIFSKILY